MMEEEDILEIRKHAREYLIEHIQEDERLKKIVDSGLITYDDIYFLGIRDACNIIAAMKLQEKEGIEFMLKSDENKKIMFDGSKMTKLGRSICSEYYGVSSQEITSRYEKIMEKYRGVE